MLWVTMFFNSLFPNSNGPGGQPNIRLVTSDNTVLPANKAVLAAHSLFFRGLLSNPAVGAALADFHLQNLAAVELRPVLKCLNHGRLFLHRDNVLHVLVAADRLGISTIYAACFMFLEEHLRPRDVVPVFKYAEDHHLPQLADLVRSFAFRNFGAVSRRREVRRASDDLLTRLFQNIREHVDDDSVSGFLARWTKGNGRTPSEALCEVMKRKHATTKTCSQLPDIHNKKQFLTDRVLHSVLFVLGGDDGAERLISVYNPAVNIWTHLTTVLPYPWTNMGAVFLKGSIYVVGGDSEPAGEKDFSRVAKLKLSTLQWRELASLNEEHYNVAVAVWDDDIYAIGGTDMEMDPTEAVERYHNHQWEFMTDMPIPRTECGAVTCNNRIYVIGGFDSAESLNSVLVYNPEANIWLPGPPMPVKKSSIRAAVVGQQIYVAGGNQLNPENGVESTMNTCHCLDLETNQWHACASMEEDREFHCIASLNGRVMVLGSQPTVEAYNPGLNLWTTLGETEHNRTNAACCTVPLMALGPELMGLLESAWMGAD